jgi:hypothetical protein
MPSKTPAQARLMSAVAHGWKKPGGGGPPVDVAKEFNEADEGGTLLRQAMVKKLRGEKGTRPR